MPVVLPSTTTLQQPLVRTRLSDQNNKKGDPMKNKFKAFLMTLLLTAPLFATAGHHEEGAPSSVGVAYSFNVSDPQAVVTAMNTYWNSPTGKKNPGVAVLRQVIAGGENPATHTIAVSYPSYAAMDEAMALNANSTDAQSFYSAMQAAAKITSRMAFDAGGIIGGDPMAVTNPLPVTAYFMMRVKDPSAYLTAWKKVSGGSAGTMSALFAVTADGEGGITHGIAVRANNMATLMSSIKSNQSTPEWTEFMKVVSPIRTLERRMITKDLAVFGG